MASIRLLVHVFFGIALSTEYSFKYQWDTKSYAKRVIC